MCSFFVPRVEYSILPYYGRVLRQLSHDSDSRGEFRCASPSLFLTVFSLLFLSCSCDEIDLIRIFDGISSPGLPFDNSVYMKSRDSLARLSEVIELFLLSYLNV